MAEAQEAFIVEFCDAWGDGSDDSRPQLDKILSMMSEDAEWQLWVPGGPTIKGKAALRKEIERQMKFASNNKCNIIHTLSSDKMVMMERADQAVVRGKPMPHSMVAIYEFDDDGLICKWREYLDTEDLRLKSGSAPSERL